MHLSDSDYAAQCRRYKLSGFLQLAELLGDDVKAAKALRAEGEFIKTPEWESLHAPKTLEFAKQVRNFMISQKFDWTNENLLKACRSVMGLEKSA